MESLEEVLNRLEQASDTTIVDWSNGNGYGDGDGAGKACGSIAQNGYGIGFKELITEGLVGIAEYNREHVYHINEHPLVLSKDKKHVFEIQPDMSLKLIDNIRLEEIIN